MGNLIDDYVNTHRPAAIQPQGISPNMKGESPAGNVTIPEAKPDSFALLEMYSKLKYNKELSGQGISIAEGKINNQDASIKTVSAIGKNNESTIYREGIIGGKKLELVLDRKVEPNTCSINYKGKYNNKDIDLTLSYPRESKFKEIYHKKIRNQLYIPDDVYVTGTIDNKPYSVHLPNTPVPRDSDTKDILTVVLDSNSFCPAVINGNIVAIEPGKSIMNHWQQKIKQRRDFFNENIKPLISQALSTVGAALIALLLAKVGLKR